MALYPAISGQEAKAAQALTAQALMVLDYPLRL